VFNNTYVVIGVLLAECESLSDKENQTVIFDIVDEFSIEEKFVSVKKYYGKESSFEFKFYKSFTDIQIVGSEGVTLKGPYVSLTIVSNLNIADKKPFIAPMHVVLVPIAVKSQWCVVDNDYERKSVVMLKNSQEWYQKNLNFDCVITKPLTPIITKLGVCLPNFIIGEFPNKQVFEIHTSDIKAVNFKKQLAQIIMSAIGPVHKYEPLTLSDNKSRNDNCFSVISAAIKATRVVEA